MYIMKEKTNFLNQLNEHQKAAVLNVEGPSLVVAGAGSGKTKVLTSKLSYLVDQKKAWPNQILCVTFTNKAAQEMIFRISSILPINTRGMWIGTFHGIAHRFLRLHWSDADLDQNFQILDADDQLRQIKKIIKELNQRKKEKKHL